MAVNPRKETEHPDWPRSGKRMSEEEYHELTNKMNTGEIFELFDGGWLQLGENGPQVRVIVARHHAPAPEKSISVGKRIDGWVYELFMTTLPGESFLVEDVLDLYHEGEIRRAYHFSIADNLPLK